MARTITRTTAFCIAVCSFFEMLVCGAARCSTPASVDSARSADGQSGRPARVALLVHGIYNSAKCMAMLERRLRADGWQVYTVSILPNDASIGFEAMGAQLKAFIDSEMPAGDKFDLVGFSMGGLVCRYYLQKMGGASRVGRFVTISTPNHGTIWACLSGRAGVKEMRPNSAMIRELNANAGELEAHDYTSVYTPFDLTVVPATSSRMGVGRNVVCWAPLHPLMLCMPGPINAVRAALE
jgi:triacylglycerol lipase